jgi:hypothetical protein
VRARLTHPNHAGHWSRPVARTSRARRPRGLCQQGAGVVARPGIGQGDQDQVPMIYGVVLKMGRKDHRYRANERDPGRLP